MILLLNSTLYEIIPDISQSSNLRKLSNDENETKSIFQSETNEEGNSCEICLEGFELKNGICFDDKDCVIKNVIEN